MKHGSEQSTACSDLSQRYERTVWMGMSVWTPADWAIVRHGTKHDGGRLVWMDRRHQRMQLSWLKCPSEPDVERAISDYRSMDAQADSQTLFEPLDAMGPWRGLRSLGERNLTRAASYVRDADRGRWVEIVLDWPDGFDADIERAVLESFVLEDGGSTPRHWRAFGMDLTVPAQWELLRVDARPADVRWMFSRPRQELYVHRMGMIDTWYDHNPQRFVQRQLPDARIEFEPAVMNGHEALRAESKEQTARVKRWMGRERTRSDLVWHCPADDALWQVTVIRPADEPVDPKDVQVDCCRQKGGV